MLAALGRNEVTLRRIALAVQAECPTRPLDIVKPVAAKPTDPTLDEPHIIITGLGRQTTRLAKCCNPMPQQAIIGYLTRDRGITIHRQNCEFLLHQTEHRSDRLLDADWSD